MRRSWFLSAALFAAMNSQQKVPPKQAGAPKPQETPTVEGQVVSATTGEPLKRAEILLSQMGGTVDRSYTTTTTAGGRFAMQDIEPGKYRVSVMKSGYARMEYGAHSPAHRGTTLSLDPGQHVRDLVLRLVPQAVITGRVVDEDGDPAPLVQMQLSRYSYTRGKRQLQNWEGAGTNDLGEYRLFGIAPGRYYLRATPQIEMGDQGNAAPSYAPTYYPGTRDASGATALELQPGTHLRGIDITLLKTRTVRLRGRAVLAGSGRPIHETGLIVTPRDERFVFNQTPANWDARGNFELRGVAPGSYFLQAQWYDEGKGKVYWARQTVDVAQSDISGIVIELIPGLELKGQLRVEGRPMASFSNLQIGLESDGPSIMGTSNGPVHADGSFTLPDIAPDQYRLDIYGLQEDYYIKSGRLGEKDVLDAGLDLTRGVTGGLEIVVSGNGGQIEGVVLNAAEQPASGATVVLVPDKPRRAQTRLYKDITTDQYGRFTIKGIAPDDYKLFAWEEIESGAYEDPDYLKSFEAMGESMSVREGSHDSAQLKLIPALVKK